MEHRGLVVQSTLAQPAAAGGGDALDRVVLHVDLDCFYAAVEQVRLGIPREEPLAVQQWEGLIAVNYPARASGIVRHDRVSEALRKCPKLQLVHVETLGSQEGGATARRRTAKVSLERYRQASSHVFSIFRRFTDLSEKASIDEVYLDVTDQVEQMVEKGCDWDRELQLLSCVSGRSDNLDNNKNPEMIIETGPLFPENQHDKRLLAGAIIAKKIRSTVRNELSYTCSVGIATNKLLAKIASARNKPDRQTLILPRAVPSLMQSFPLKKIKMLGGKLGEDLNEKWRCETAGDVQALPLEALISRYGERLGNYIWKAVRGIYTEKVQVKQVSKSMLAAKSFSATDNLTAIRKWLQILAEELAIRILRDVEQNHRQPRCLQLFYRSGSLQQSSEHSKSSPMPQAALRLLASGGLDLSENAGMSMHCPEPEQSGFCEGQYESFNEELEKSSVNEIPNEENVLESDSVSRENIVASLGTGESGQGMVAKRASSLAKILEDATFAMFRQIDGALPCTRLAMAAHGFEQLPSQGSKSIEHFFTKAPLQAREASVQDKSLASLTNSEIVHGRSKGILQFMIPASEAKRISVVSDKDKNGCGSNSAGSCQTTEGSCPTMKTDPSKNGVEVPTCSGTDDYGQQDGRFDAAGNNFFVQDSDDGTREEIDLSEVNIEEQHRILRTIHGFHTSVAGPENRQISGPRHQESHVLKRRRLNDSQSGQQSISSFFQYFTQTSDEKSMKRMPP